MYEHIGERVAVLVLFGKQYKEVRPFKLKWHDKEYQISHVDYHHKYKDGNSLIHVFSATDGTNFFELKYNSEDLSWMLGNVSDNEAT